MKKVTIKDVAKAANVSIATVSYVINNRNDEKISEETKKKIFQWINLLGYVRNDVARSLVTSKTMNIAFISSPKLTYLQKLELMNFLELFSLFVGEKGYKVFYIYQIIKDVINNADAIVCYNMTEEQFYELGNLQSIPMIAVDLLLNDPIFYQITKDYHVINLKAKQFFNGDFILITLKPQAITVEKEILNCFNKVIFVTKLEEVVDIIHDNYSKNILLFDSFIKNIFEALHPDSNIFYYSIKEVECFKKIFECIEAAINRVDDKEHYIKI